MPLDLPTLFVVSSCVTVLLGLFLLCLWFQDRTLRALGWWAGAYLTGGLAILLWVVLQQTFASGMDVIAGAVLLAGCGMVWCGARRLHGREPLALAATTGALVWLLACQLSFVSGWPMGRVALSALIVAAYAWLTGIEFRRERRNAKAAKVRALVIALLHAAVFPAPVAAISLAGIPSDGTGGWLALYVLLALLYAISAAFVAMVMTKERSAQAHKTAAMTDCMTGLFNRRGFLHAADRLIAAQRRKDEAVSVLMFDLDHFKSINDRFGHEAGDDALRAFAITISGTMRSGDIIGRLGGEEFAAILSGDIDKATVAAERVRAAFARAGASIAGYRMNATVSVGAAAAVAGGETVASLLSRADAALYEAKRSGRNCLKADDMPTRPSAFPYAPDAPSRGAPAGVAPCAV